MMRFRSFHWCFWWFSYIHNMRREEKLYHIKNVPVSHYSVSNTVNSGCFWKSVWMEQGCSDTSLACTPIATGWQLPDWLGHQRVFAFLPGISPTVFWPYAYRNVLWQEVPQLNSKLCKKNTTCSCLFWIYDLLSSVNIFLLRLLLGETVVSHSLFPTYLSHSTSDCTVFCHVPF